ncbi:histidinol-phosphatase [Hyphobacterium sp.]|jgi:histidinol phosphatase-like enzyme (inositol monophosphatase family)|uniref:histidinol-phosphatase n=1 Tax=Hyphobacterium sp. TaxID=2004662 RepID=UPI003BAA7108
MNRRDLDTELALAHRLADAAGAAILPYFRQAPDVENKAASGFDPVTAADRAAEQAMRELIRAERPGDGVLGEEFPPKDSRNGWSWTLDPIDGTRGFIAGSPTWCVLIALTYDGRPVLGVIDQPHTGERFSGHGKQAGLQIRGARRELAVSGTAALADAILATTDPYLFRDREAELFSRLHSDVRLTRFGMDAYAYALLAAGGIDLVVESGLGPHDIHALIPVVRGAGGLITDWRGGDDFATGRLVAAATRELHAAALEKLAL